MKSIILIASCFYLIIFVIGMETPNLSEQDQAYKKTVPEGYTQVSGYRCGELLFRSNHIEDTRAQACRRLKSLNIFHRYPKKYRPRQGSQLATHRTPGQNLYIYPLGASKMKSFRKPFSLMEPEVFILITQDCELEKVFRIKKKQCRHKICIPSAMDVEKPCQQWNWSVKVNAG